MSNNQSATLKFVAGSSNAIALAQAVAAAGALALNGAIGSGAFDAPRRIVINSSSAGDSGLVFTVVGVNRSGAPITEKITGVAAVPGTVSAFDYASVASITSSGAATGNISAGTSNATTIGSSEWMPLNTQITPMQMAIWVTVASANPSTYTIEFTPDDPNVMPYPGGIAQVAGSGAPGTYPQTGQGSIAPQSFIPPGVWADTTLVAKAANGHVVINDCPMFWRLTINAGTTAVTAQGIQAGVRN